MTNGVNADGSEILLKSAKNFKDVWLDADYLFGPDGGITFMTYQGRKDQVQNEGTPSEFTFRPNLRRYGFFGNYLFFDKLDIQAGYLRSDDDWKDSFNGKTSSYIANGYRGEVDYYLQRGFALVGRYDRLSETIAGGRPAHTEDWGAGGEKTLTDKGNIIVRATYRHRHGTDPVSDSLFTDKLFKVDLRLMW